MGKGLVSFARMMRRKLKAWSSALTCNLETLSGHLSRGSRFEHE